VSILSILFLPSAFLFLVLTLLLSLFPSRSYLSSFLVVYMLPLLLLVLGISSNASSPFQQRVAAAMTIPGTDRDRRGHYVKYQPQSCPSLVS